MKPRRAKYVAGVVVVLSGVCVGGWALSRLAGGSVPIYAFWGEAIAVVAAFPTLGYLIVRRQPDNRVGWLFVALGATAGPELLIGQTAIALRSGWLGLVSEILRLGGLIAVGFLVLLYPSGRLLSLRWRWAGWLIAAGMAAAVGGIVLSPGPIEGVPVVTNPLGSQSLSSVAAVLEVMTLLALAGVVAGIVSLFVRYRRSGLVARQQIKLFALTPAAIIVVLVAANVLLPKQMEGPLGSILWGSPAVLLPAAATIAITRHGLYEIDRIISRTLSYAIVTVVLGGAFALIVLLPTTLVGSRAKTPDWLVAVGTLAVAALFRPVRRRIQTAVDHRFNRRRFDAAQTIDAFAARLRDEVDINTLKVDLETLVHHTMQPAHVSLWLAQDVRDRR